MSNPVTPPWSAPIRLSEILRLSQPLKLEPDEATRARIAKTLDLVELPRFTAQARLVQWLDGVELKARWSAEVIYRCGISLEPFSDELEGDFAVKAVPPGSPAAQPDADEVEFDLEADDPPDVLDGEIIDLGVYMVEHLALELDAFPRKPGVVFEPPPPEEPPSPFSVLRLVTPKNDDEKA